jgi:SAM-dependent methyltransferase
VTAAEVFARGLRAPEDCLLRLADGDVRPVPLGRWLVPATAVDERVVSRAAGPVLDVGCGPGRHVRALARRGVLALGVDVSPAAVSLARRRGTAVIEGSVFSRVPAAGTWGSALLLDGNLGIAGNPRRLLRRVRALLASSGSILVETDPPGWPTRATLARLESAGVTSEWFPWALVGADGLAAEAAAAGVAIAERWEDGGRWFAALR